MRRIGVIAILAAMVALLAGGVIWVASHRPPKQKWTLSDGSEVSLVKVTHGTNNVVIDGGWRDLVYPVLPGFVRNKLKWQVGVCSPFWTNGLVVWVKWKRPPQATSPNGFLGLAATELRVTATDEDGLELVTAYLQFTGTTTGPLAIELRNYPRRNRGLALVFYDESGGYGREVKVGAIKVSNPAPSKAQVWTAETLPATRDTNGLRISLLKLQTGMSNMWGSQSRAVTEGRRYSRAIFDLRVNGERATNWAIGNVQASAPTGDEFSPNAYGGNWSKEGFNFNFQGAFWLEEPAWKLTAVAWRTADFPAEELWTIRGIRVPTSQEVVEVHEKMNIDGVQAELLGLGGPIAATPSGWNFIGGFRNNSHFYARLVGPAPDVHLSLVEVCNDQGKRLKASLAGSSSTNSSSTTYGFTVEIPDGAKTLDIAFAVSKSRTAEFLVKPELAK